MTDVIRMPAAWDKSKAFDLLQIQAGQAYILQQIDHNQTLVEPEYQFQSSRTNGDQCGYDVFSDGSLYFWNNAEDEVWCDYHDFVQDQLLPGLAANDRRQSPMVWSDDDAGDDTTAWVIDELDRGLLLLFCDGDEGEARKLVGCEPETAT